MTGRAGSRSIVMGVALAATVFGDVALGCAAEPLGVREDAIAIPGDWDPPATTRALAAMQHVDVVDPPAVLPLGSCTSTNPWEGTCTHPACLRAHPGTTDLDVYIRGRWPYVGAGGTYTCRRNSNPASTAYLSVHSVGRAIDLMITTIGGDADNTAGDAVANWLIENAMYIGIQRVIWDGWYWNGERGFSEISDRMSGGRYVTDHHVNHIHVELSVDGAARRTRFFTEGAPPATCPIVCYGTAVVAADCSYVDCAASGQVCLDGPPRCGAGAPPEPAEATLDAAAPLPTASAVAGLSRFLFVPPTRLFDTRTPSESTRLVRSDASTGPIGGARTGTVTDWPGLPSGATSAWMNVTTVPLAAPGFLNVVPAGTTSGTSTVNFTPPRVRANATVVPFGAGGGVTFGANTDVEVIADWSGTFTTVGGLGLQTAGPLRVIDTRALGTPLVGGTPFSVDVRLPTGATGVVASVTVVGGAADGFLIAYPCAASVPGTSNLNFRAGSVSTNTVVSETSDGRLCFFSNVGAELIVDVTGYLQPAFELSFQAIAPTRLLDTRTPGTRWVGRLGERQTIELPIQALPGMPADVHAVVVNVVAVPGTSRGYVTAFPCGVPNPGTASLNYDSDDPAAALAVSPVGGGSLCLFSSARTHVIVDLLGVFVPTPAAPPPTPGPGPTDPDEPEEMEPPTMPGDDAGTPMPIDGAPTTDGGTARADASARETPPVSGGCGCRAARREPGGPALTLALALTLAGVLARRSRAR